MICSRLVFCKCEDAYVSVENDKLFYRYHRICIRVYKRELHMRTGNIPIETISSFGCEITERSARGVAFHLFSVLRIAAHDKYHSNNTFLRPNTLFVGCDAGHMGRHRCLGAKNV